MDLSFFTSLLANATSSPQAAQAAASASQNWFTLSWVQGAIGVFLTGVGIGTGYLIKHKEKSEEKTQMQIAETTAAEVYQEIINANTKFRRDVQSENEKINIELGNAKARVEDLEKKLLASELENEKIKSELNKYKTELLDLKRILNSYTQKITGSIDYETEST